MYFNCTKLGSSAGDMLKYSYRNFSIKPPKGLIVCKHFRRRGGGGLIRERGLNREITVFKHFQTVFSHLKDKPDARN